MKDSPRFLRRDSRVRAIDESRRKERVVPEGDKEFQKAVLKAMKKIEGNVSLHGAIESYIQDPSDRNLGFINRILDKRGGAGSVGEKAKKNAREVLSVLFKEEIRQRKAPEAGKLSLKDDNSATGLLSMERGGEGVLSNVETEAKEKEVVREEKETEAKEKRGFLARLGDSITRLRSRNDSLKSQTQKVKEVIPTNEVLEVDTPVESEELKVPELSGFELKIAQARALIHESGLSDTDVKIAMIFDPYSKRDGIDTKKLYAEVVEELGIEPGDPKRVLYRKSQSGEVGRILYAVKKALRQKEKSERRLTAEEREEARIEALRQKQHKINMDNARNPARTRTEERADKGM